MKDERGFVYPTTLLLLFLVVLVITYHADVYLYEKRYVVEQERLLLLESLLQMAVVDFINTAENGMERETFSYKHGTVTLNIYPREDDQFYVVMAAQLPEGNQRTATFFLQFLQK